MSKCLLSIDWDYFICSKENRFSYAETPRNIVDSWYKRYFLLKMQGKDARNLYALSPEVKDFWAKISQKFIIGRDITAYISDSHSLSYHIAQNTGCSSVYLFDAHSDLGYGGLSSLNFELNCANWLGKLLKDGIVVKANIIYSPYTAEKPQDFEEINNAFSVEYLTWRGIPKGIVVAVIHICRSGAWTPPWYDHEFLKFIKNSGLHNMEFIDCIPRKWDIRNIDLSQQINYMLA